MSENIEKLSVGEVNDVLKAFDFLSFSNSYNNTYYNSYFTPDMVNRKMQDVTMQTGSVSTEAVNKALQSPKESEDILRQYSMSLELTNMFYKRLLRYFSDLPAFNVTFDCYNVQKDADYNSALYKKDLKIVDEFLTKFNYKAEFQSILRQVMRQGVYYGVLRMDEEKYAIQELPAGYCKLTGRHPYGLLFDFNMQYFMDVAGVDINMYPKIFKKMYTDVYTKLTADYKPSTSPLKRDSSFVFWHQCNPSNGFWAFKIDPEIATLVPFFAPLFSDIAMTPVVRGLQEDKFFIEASKMLVGILGFNKDTKSGQVANQVNITPEVLGKFLGIARKGLNKQIGLTALPVDDIEVVEFKTTEANLVSNQTKSVAEQSSASSATLLSDTKLSVHQSKLAAAIDANIVKNMYPMFSNFMEFFVNQKTKKFRFKFTFHDVNTPDDVSARQTLVKDMSQLGIVDAQNIARLYDMDVFQLKRSLQMSNSFGIDKCINTMLIPSMIVSQNSAQTNPPNNNNGVKNPVGRPAKPDSDNENTIASNERDSNAMKE